jgi:hypothetical protein
MLRATKTGPRAIKTGLRAIRTGHRMFNPLSTTAYLKRGIL